MLVLPKGKKELTEALKHLLAKGISVMNPRLAEWILNRAYMSGVRNFPEVDYGTGQVRYKFVNEHDSALEFKNEELLRDYQIEMGRFLGMDVRHAVKMKGWGLDRLRKASVAQVILDYQAPEEVVSRVRVPFNEQLLQCGFSGIQASVERAGLLSGESVLEVAPAWEILPVPFNAMSPGLTQGLIRTRWVSLAWLKNQPELWATVKAKTQKDALQVREVDWTEIEAAAGGDPVGHGVLSADILGMFGSAFRRSVEAAYGPDKKAGKHREGRQIVRVTEVWLNRRDGTVRRYLLMVGETVAVDDNFEADGITVYQPLGLARYYPSGFYGRPYITPLRHFCHEAEQSLKAVFQNLKDLDSLGLVTLPTGLGISDAAFKLDEHPRKVYFEPDPLGERAGIGQIAPHTTGTLPQQVMGIAGNYIQKLSGQGELFLGGVPGRVDSNAALGFLLETNNVGIEAPGNSVADAFTTAYTALLSAAKEGLVQIDLAEILTLDTPTVGVVVTEEGGLDLAKNPVPDPREVFINIKSRTPPSPTQEIQNLTMLYQQQLIDPMDFRLTVCRKGLPLEVANEAEYQAWRKIRLNIRILFNDGETPRVDDVAVDPDVDLVEVCTRELGAFAAGPEFAMASPDVKTAFRALLKFYKQMAGGFPEQLPYPEVYAEMSGNQAGAPPGGPAGPPAMP